jgi:hypothetical protein
MDTSLRNLLIGAPLIILAMVGAFLYARFLLRKALKDLVKIFRDHQALSPASARTGMELGIDPPGTFSIRSFWDQKPAALTILLRSGVIQVTEEGLFFLSEETLDKADEGRTIS